MAQCEVFSALSKNHPTSMPPINDCSKKNSQPHQSEFKFYSNTYLPEDYFSYDKAVSFFRQGVTERPPGGLINVGYNCYMNSVIQCLAFTPGFQQFCLSLQNSMYEKNRDGALFFKTF